MNMGEFCTFPLCTVAPKIYCRKTVLLGGVNLKLQIQNRAARRIHFHYKDRSVGMSAENISLQIQILSLIPLNFHPDADFGLEKNSIIILTTKVPQHGVCEEKWLYIISLAVVLRNFVCDN